MGRSADRHPGLGLPDRRAGRSRRSRSAILLIAFAVGPGCAFLHDEAPWLEDLSALEGQLANAYANLDDTAARYDIDLTALSDSSRKELADSGSDRASRNVLGRFVEAFRDPHLRLQDPPSWLGQILVGGGSDLPIEPGISGGEAVSRMGFSNDNYGFRIDFEDDPTFEEISEGTDHDPFASGILTIGGYRVGVLRIAEFGVNRYATVAAAAVDADPSVLTEGAGAVWLAAEQALVDRLSDRVARLKERGIDALTIDVTKNGGGTDWADPAARILTGRPLRGAPVSMVRHPHHEKSLLDSATQLEAVLTIDGIDPEERETISSSLSRIRSALDEVRERGDRSGAFQGDEPATPLLSRGALFATGAVDYLPPNALLGVPDREEVFSPLRYRYSEGVWSGPLFVLVDRNTASASEQFVALLRDGEACEVIGLQTLGAGAGYTNGGIQFTLPNSGMRLWASDIIRHRQDGTNELFGIAPDIEIEEESDLGDPRTWTAAIAKALARGA